MFGKLLKYEFKSISKWYLVLLFITSIVAFATGNFLKVILSNINTDSAYSTGYEFGRLAAQEISFIMLFIILMGLTLSITIASYVIIIRRFYSSIFSRQGYLTMTLPVSSHAIILSKLLVAVFLFLATYLIFAVIGAAFIIPTVGWEGIKVFLDVISYEILPLTDPLWVMLSGINIFASNITGVLLIYLAIASGQLFNNYRILMGFVSYGLLITIVILLFSILSSAMPLNSLILAEIVLNTFLMIFSYIATHTIIKYKLNLE